MHALTPSPRTRHAEMLRLCGEPDLGEETALPRKGAAGTA